MKIDVTNYLTDSADRVKRFAGEVTQALEAGIGQTRYGFYKSRLGLKGETGVGPAASTVARVAAPFITGEAQLQGFRSTSPFIQARKLGQQVSTELGVGPVAGAVAAVGVPALIAGMSGITGSPLKGFRPAGQKAVYPVSKEEDPTGATSKSPVVEAGMRYFLGQKGNLLPYQQFKEERPDVMPSTYRDYMRYQYSKPEAGKTIEVDPERGTFTALGGAIKGSAKGLNDPEIRVRGVPVTASAVLGTAAGLATTKALANTLKPETPYGKEIQDLTKKVGELKIDVKSPAARAGEYGENLRTAEFYQQKLKGAEQQLAQAKQLRAGELTGAAKQFEKLGPLRDPALLAAGTAAALGTAAVVKGLMAKAQERKVKKEDPVEYLKYKHGDFSTAAQALGQPEARSWQELSQYVN